jgi:hypothetical protein
MPVIQFKTKLSPNQYAMLSHENEVRLHGFRPETDNEAIKYLRRQVGHRLITACKYV